MAHFATVTPPYPTIEILGVSLARLDKESALREIERLYEQDAPALVAYANAHTLNLASRDPEYRELLNGADILLNDGVGAGMAARAKGGRFPDNLNGSDFNPEILGLAAARGWSVYLMGAKPGVAQKAAEALREQIPHLEIAGCQHGFFPKSSSPAVADDIKRSGATVVMVGMGNPVQERWLRDHLEATGCRMGVGVGAFLDFEAGTARRAPAWMNRAGIEWMWRLAQEPKRLWKRYIAGNPLFLYRVYKERRRSRS